MDETIRGTLLRLARHALEASLDDRPLVIPPDPWLQAPGAAFVSLRQRPGGALRGCVGSVEARQPLGHAVASAAIAAAFRDARFKPVVAAELSSICVEISVLSPLEPLPVASEADARSRLDRSRPGVVLQAGWRRSVLLPKVWDSIEDAGEFLRHLKLKAGLPAGFWSDSIELSVFTCDELAEPDDRPAAEAAS